MTLLKIGIAHFLLLRALFNILKGIKHCWMMSRLSRNVLSLFSSIQIFSDRGIAQHRHTQSPFFVSSTYHSLSCRFLYTSLPRLSSLDPCSVEARIYANVTLEDTGTWMTPTCSRPSDFAGNAGRWMVAARSLRPLPRRFSGLIRAELATYSTARARLGSRRH